MPSLYVAGPVVDPDEVPEIYRFIADWGAARGWDIRLPLRDPYLTEMPPEKFAHQVAYDIDTSDAVLALVVPGDQSVPSEITTAAREAKPQVLVAMEPRRIPRLLSGQPGVVAVMPSDDVPRALAALEDAWGTREST